jgi:hypothetical protein
LEGNFNMARQRAVADDSVFRDPSSAFRAIRHMHGDQDAAMFEIRHIGKGRRSGADTSETIDTSMNSRHVDDK